MRQSDEAFNHDIDVIREALGHSWTSAQEPLVRCRARQVLGSGGERAGKSYIAADFFNVRGSWQGKLYWIAGADYDRCHAEFEYIARAMLQLEAVKPENVHTPHSGQWWMKLSTGAILKTWSLQDWLKVGSEAPDGIIISEVAQISHEEYKRLTDRTAEKRGWVCGTGTFEGSLGWYPETWKLYQLPGQAGESFSLPSWSNLAVYPGGENDPEIVRLKTSHSVEYFSERFGGVPCPPTGLVFPEFRVLHHVREFEIFDAPIYLWVDPGYDGAYAVEAVQVVGETVYVVDEIYERGLVTEQITQVVMQKPWFSLVDGGAVDIAARQHQGMPAVEEVWGTPRTGDGQDGWPGISLTSNRVEEAEGRERLHTFLTINPIDGQPRMLIRPHCVGLISEFGGCPNPFTGEGQPYSWKRDRTGIVVGHQPEDKNNHAIKAMTYGVVDKFGYVTHSNRITPVHSLGQRRPAGKTKLRHGVRMRSARSH